MKEMKHQLLVYIIFIVHFFTVVALTECKCMFHVTIFALM